MFFIAPDCNLFISTPLVPALCVARVEMLQNVRLGLHQSSDVKRGWIIECMMRTFKRWTCCVIGRLVGWAC